MHLTYSASSVKILLRGSITSKKIMMDDFVKNNHLFYSTVVRFDNPAYLGKNVSLICLFSSMFGCVSRPYCSDSFITSLNPLLTTQTSPSCSQSVRSAIKRKICWPRAGPGQTNRPDAPIPCAVSKNLANRDATCLPLVDTHKPEKRVLEVEGHARDLHMYQHTSLASDSV